MRICTCMTLIWHARWSEHQLYYTIYYWRACDGGLDLRCVNFDTKKVAHLKCRVLSLSHTHTCPGCVVCTLGDAALSIREASPQTTPTVVTAISVSKPPPSSLQCRCRCWPVQIEVETERSVIKRKALFPTQQWVYKTDFWRVQVPSQALVLPFVWATLHKRRSEEKASMDESTLVTVKTKYWLLFDDKKIKTCV